MRVLLQRSHCSSLRADGWSGAPGEAAYVRELVDQHLAPRLRAWGVEVVVVDGDLGIVADDSDQKIVSRHPEYLQDYDAFLAPHYESDTHGAGASGQFWGRASQSLTSASDDQLGSIWERRYQALVGEPPDAQGWVTTNITDYYGFRCTSAHTPGILTELGIGNGADHDWLRANLDLIALTLAHALAEFMGFVPEEEDMLTQEQFNKLALAWWVSPEVAGPQTLYDMKQVQFAQQAVLVKLQAGTPLDPTELASIEAQLKALDARLDAIGKAAQG